MAVIKTLKVSNGSSWGIQDHRLTSSANAVSDANWKSANNTANAASNGDIYLRTGSMPTVQTSNGWYYITRPDGATECWKTVSIGNVSASSWWGNYCYSSTLSSQSAVTYPVTFSEAPCVIMFIESTAYNGFIGLGVSASTTYPARPYLLRPGSAGSFQGVKIFYHVIGKKS